MDKIIQIQYQGRSFSIEETAYILFQEYEKELKNYFNGEEAGDEIFSDLQHRMGEILEQKNVSGPLYKIDIEELIATIGKPSDFAAEQEGTAPNDKIETPLPRHKKLFRNKKDKIIAGVCSGIANYFDIDPIAVRLIFVLFTIFNLATFMKFNMGLLIYIILWIILKPAILKPNLTRKLFRNPTDKVLGGVCSGIAQFFNTETWIVRLLFLAPVLLGFLTSHSNFSRVNIDIVGHSLYSISLISYIILWFITPLAKVTTDYMLLKGEPINLSTIQNTTTMQEVTSNSHSGLNKFLKIIAYIIIGLIVMIMIPTAIGILIAAVYSYGIAEIVLFSTVNKVLALLSISLFLALPVVGLIVWLIRRVMGLKQSKTMRIIFIGLNVVGWISIIWLASTLVRQNNTYSSTENVIHLPSGIDTLRIQSTDTTDTFNETVFFEINQVDYLLEKTDNENQIKAVMLEYEETTDTSFSIEIKKSGFGENRGFAFKHATDAVFNYSLDSNILKLSPHIAVSNKEPYYLQHVCITIYVPAGKTVITTKKLKRQISHSFSSSRHGVRIHHNGDDMDEDDVYSNGVSHRSAPDAEMERKERLREADERLKEIEAENLEMIKEKERELEEARKKLKQELKDAKRDLEDIKKN